MAAGSIVACRCLSARRRLTLAYSSRANHTFSAQHSARATRHAHDLARRSLSHAHTHQREIRRTARSTPPTHRLLALASNSRADRTTQFAQQHAPAHCAPSPLRTRAHTSVRNTPRTHHIERPAPHIAHTQRSPSAPLRSPSAHAPRLASSVARRVTTRAAVGAQGHRHATEKCHQTEPSWGGGIALSAGLRTIPHCGVTGYNKLGTPCPSLPERPLLRPLHHHPRGDVGGGTQRRMAMAFRWMRLEQPLCSTWTRRVRFPGVRVLGGSSARRFGGLTGSAENKIWRWINPPAPQAENRRFVALGGRFPVDLGELSPEIIN